MKPIYEPKGKANEYADGGLALNIYTGCTHRCQYCYVPSVLHKDKEDYHSFVTSRANIFEETRKQIEKEHITGKTIFLCFSCDPYPTGYDSWATRDIIQILKEYGNHVQILTKGDGSRDFDLLDEHDWYGITISCNYPQSKMVEPGAISPRKRLDILREAKNRGVKTWVSFEPVIDDKAVLKCASEYAHLFDKVKVGKLNYHPSDINWKDFGRKIEDMLLEAGVDYYIKYSLRQDMEK